MATTPSIVDVYPAPSAQGIPVGDQVRVIFNQEMDLDSINTGTFVLTGPDDAPVFGPLDITPFDEPGFEDEDILSSPYFKGYVKGTITFRKCGHSLELIDDDATDTTGQGDSWYTVAIFTPDKPLKPNVEYTCILLGDEAPTDDYDTGIKTRTVFDPVFTGSGTGRLSFYGGYTGSENRTYIIEIVSGGVTGDAEYIWWRESDPLTTYAGVTSTGARELEDGIYVLCEPDGSFTIGDQFQVVVIPALTLANNYQWSFSTGSGSIITPPSTSSASGIDSITSGSTYAEVVPVFQVSDIDPEDGEYGVTISTDPYAGELITITFNNNVDPLTLGDSAISVISTPARGRSDLFTAVGELDFVATLTDNILEIQLGPSQLYTNNVVIITLDKSIADIDGYSLGTNQEFYFTTTYTPLYSSEQIIRLDLGPIMVGVPRETIMSAILGASIQTDTNIFNTTISNLTLFNEAKWQYTTCMAEMTLIRAMLGGQGLSDKMYKSLGDLSISRGGIASNLRDTLAGLEDCAVRWEITVQSGGKVAPGGSVSPQISVKGALARDRIVVHRQWEPTSGIGYDSYSAGNATGRRIGRRALKTFRKRH
jgi:hypothetical protein